MTDRQAAGATGFGTRRMEEVNGRRMEVLTLSAPLATPESEAVIRARLRTLQAFAPGIGTPGVVERVGDALLVTTDTPAGVPVAELLRSLEAGAIELSDSALLELGSLVVRTVAAFHAHTGTLAHGAITPHHLLLRADGGVSVTGVLLGDAVEQLQRNREQLWREFALALPPAASLPRFDRRADLTQLGSVLLALLMRRPLRAAEYPRAVPDLIMGATAGLACGSALRMWLHHVLQIHPKAAYSSAGDAAAALSTVLASVNGRRANVQAIRAAAQSFRAPARLDTMPCQ